MKACYLVFDGDYSSLAFRLQIICIFLILQLSDPITVTRIRAGFASLNLYLYLRGHLSHFLLVTKSQTVDHIIVCRQNPAQG